MTKSANQSLTTCESSTSISRGKSRPYLKSDLKTKLSKLLEKPRQAYLQRQLTQKASVVHVCTETSATKRVHDLHPPTPAQREIWRIAAKIARRKQPYEETIEHLQKANISVPEGWDKVKLLEWLCAQASLGLRGHDS